MKTYKDFSKVYIGDSDIASLVLRFCEGGITEVHFGEDGAYSAYLINENDVEIPEHYELVASGGKWLMVYDDNERTQNLRADKINVYRAAMRGCIIHLIN